MSARTFCRLLVLILLVAPAASFAQSSQSAAPFYPTWKLLSRSEKQQFVAGYTQGWHDAARVTEITIGYVKENPTRAVEGLEQIKRLYDLQDVKPAVLASAIDVYFQQPENQNDGLSQAVSAARRAIVGK